MENQPRSFWWTYFAHAHRRYVSAPLLRLQRLWIWKKILAILWWPPVIGYVAMEYRSSCFLYGQGLAIAIHHADRPSYHDQFVGELSCRMIWPSTLGCVLSVLGPSQNASHNTKAAYCAWKAFVGYWIIYTGSTPKMLWRHQARFALENSMLVRTPGGALPLSTSLSVSGWPPRITFPIESSSCNLHLPQSLKSGEIFCMKGNKTFAYALTERNLRSRAKLIQRHHKNTSGCNASCG